MSEDVSEREEGYWYHYAIAWRDIERHVKVLEDSLRKLGVKWTYNYNIPDIFVGVDQKLSKEQVKELERIVKEFYKALIDKMKLVWVGRVK